MNNERRKRLNAIYSKLEDLRSDLDAVRTDEQDAFDNMPESVQSGERGEAMMAAINDMENADGSLDEALGSIDEAKAGA